MVAVVRTEAGGRYFLLRLQNKILKLIAEGAALDQAMGCLAEGIDSVLPGVGCTIISVDRAGLLHPLASTDVLKPFCASFEGVMIGPDAGSCGTAAYLRKSVGSTDITTDPRFASARYLEGLVPLGFRACWSTPVLGENGVPIGVLALYYRETRGPAPSEQERVAAIVELCELALRRHERVLERERQATIDALTGLPNRAAFNAVLASVPCKEPGSWALFMVDLDNLKVVNDTFGHAAGDGLIQAAAERIATAMTPDLAFRLGGDEFAVLIQSAEALVDLEHTASRIFDNLEQVADCAGHSVVPTATIGGAVLGAGEAATSVCQNADFALYHAKETGRGGFVRYWPGIGTRMTRRREAVRDVRVALKDGRIDAHYQPIVRLETHEIVGVEALCRLRSETGKVVAAETFLEATSDAHIAEELTDRMLSIVADDLRRWLDDGIPVQHVSINVSTADFYTGNLMPMLRASFGRAGVSLDHLILEVNEDVYMGRRDKVAERQMKLLREGGIRVALDNFGTGFASLTRLRDVPVDIIKIDRSFIARLWPEDPSMVIVQGLIDIARQLDIRVVAEGIESEVQASQLWSMGCRLGQGFAFSKPLDRVAIAELLKRHSQGIAGAIPLYVESDAVHRRLATEGDFDFQLTGTG